MVPFRLYEVFTLLFDISDKRVYTRQTPGFLKSLLLLLSNILLWRTSSLLAMPF